MGLSYVFFNIVFVLLFCFVLLASMLFFAPYWS